MKTSTQVVGVLIVMAGVFGVAVLPVDRPLRALLAALVITISSGTMAYLRARQMAHRR